MEELRPISETDERILKIKEKLSVAKLKIYTGPFPVIKPTKELTKKEIEEILKPKKKKL